MSTIQEIEEAVRRLPPDEFSAFRAWFAEFAADAWDVQLEEDIREGRLDSLADEAIAENRSGRTTDR